MYTCAFRGHGTFMQDDKLHASVAGVVERVNKLICIKPLKTRSVFHALVIVVNLMLMTWFI